MESVTLSDNELSKKLIELVKERPYLYDKDVEENRDDAKKMEGWISVADALGLGVDETQMRWTRLRIEFGRQRRKRQAAEASGTQVRDWPLYDLILWLAPHVKMRAKRDKRKRGRPKRPLEILGYKPILPRPEWYVSMDRGVSVEVNPSIVMQNGHEDITESFIVSPDTADYEDDAASMENVHQHYAMKNSKEHSYSSNSHAADSRTGLMSSAEESDEDNLFCRSICASLRRFTYQQKALAKIRIQQVMYEVEFNQTEGLNEIKVEK